MGEDYAINQSEMEAYRASALYFQSIRNMNAMLQDWGRQNAYFEWLANFRRGK
jgi:hypothetical protein